jgi:DNA-binding transcriptional ArsR family regulator
VPGVFEALGDPVRRLILKQLAAGEQPTGTLVTALQSLMQISQPAVSQHLKVLREAGLVSVRATGTRRIYALDQTGVDTARAWLGRLGDPLAPFTQPLDALETELARGRRARRAAARDQHRGPESAEQGAAGASASAASMSIARPAALLPGERRNQHVQVPRREAKNSLSSTETVNDSIFLWRQNQQ